MRRKFWALKQIFLSWFCEIKIFFPQHDFTFEPFTSMCSTINRYMTCLALSDTIVDITAVCTFTFENLRDSYASIQTAFINSITILYPLAMIAQTCSVYFTVAAGLECFFETYKLRILHRKSQKYVIIGVLVFTLVYNFPHFLEITVKPCFDEDSYTTRMEICATALRLNEDYMRIYYRFLPNFL